MADLTIRLAMTADLAVLRGIMAAAIAENLKLFLILDNCEAAARRESFGRLQLAATLAGEPLYRAYGFREIERFTDSGMPLIRMEKRLAKSALF